MPRLSLEISHALGLEEATQRLKDKFAAALTEHRERLSEVRQQWTDHSLAFAFQAMGMAVSGHLAVAPETVKLDADLPLAAMFFKGAIEDRLRREVGRLLTS